MKVRRNIMAALRNRFDAALNVVGWRRKLAPLRDLATAAPVHTILFCDLMTMPSTAKVESLMAGVMRLKGYRALVLMERPDWAIEGIFRAATPDVEFVYREHGIGPDDLVQARRQADSILSKYASLQALVDLEIDNFRIGRNVQSKVLRQFRVGRLDDADPRHREAARDTLTQSLATKAFVQQLLRDKPVDAAVFVERGYTPAGEVFDGCIATGVDVVQWCGAPQPDCLIYRRYDAATRGEHPLALSDDMWRRLQAMPWSDVENELVVRRIAANYQSGTWYNRQQLQDGKNMMSPNEVQRRLALDPAKKTAVIFCHILYDATFFYGESLYEDYEQWMVETVRAAIANPSLNWIVKVHPANIWRSRMDGAHAVQLEAEVLRKHFGKLPDHVKIMPAETGVNTFSLFDVIDYGLTVRGTIGMELPCFGIPVVTAGTGRYSGRGFTSDPYSRTDYAALLARLHDVPRLNEQEIRRARLHYYGALQLRPVPMQSFFLNYQSGKHNDGRLKQDVSLNVPPGEKLLASNDLGRFAVWVAQQRSIELLSRDI